MFEDVEKLIKTKVLDVESFAKRLHKIRSQAQEMENGLKRRKKVMTEFGLEKRYQKYKKKFLTPEGINKVANVEGHMKGERPTLEFIVKESGEIIYQNYAHAGVMSIVEKLEPIDQNGMQEGTTQKFFFGHILAQWFAFNQLTQAFEDKSMEILANLKHMSETGYFKKPEIQDQIRRMAEMSSK